MPVQYESVNVNQKSTVMERITWCYRNKNFMRGFAYSYEVTEYGVICHLYEAPDTPKHKIEFAVEAAHGFMKMKYPALFVDILVVNLPLDWWLELDGRDPLSLEQFETYMVAAGAGKPSPIHYHKARLLHWYGMTMDSIKHTLFSS